MATPSTSTSTTMDPPPPQPPSSNSTVSTTVHSSSSSEMQEPPKQSSMAPPPNPSYSIAELPPPSSSFSSTIEEKKQEISSHKNSKENPSISVPYTIPSWSEPPSLPFFLEVLKDGAIIDNLDVMEKGAYMFGRIDMCDFILEHPTISRFHAVLQFKGSEAAYLYDLGSTHGTFINKKQVKMKEYVDLHVGDVIRFGLSTRLYIFQGPEELMLPEADLSRYRYAKDREASLRKAKEATALSDGTTWGMREDAVEENEDDLDEITWQSYKGELTEKQQKTREKVLKRMEKILEELESLEETLNDSIRESLGARAGKSARGKQKGFAEDEDEFSSDDDEFYDRTKKKTTTKLANTQSVETADSLMDKKDALLKEMEEKKRSIFEEKNKPLEPMTEQDTGDALDAFMSGLSSQIVVDRTVQLEKDLSSLQTELDRIIYLLKIADPTGESANKRVTTSKENKSKESAPSISAFKKPEKLKTEVGKVGQQLNIKSQLVLVKHKRGIYASEEDADHISHDGGNQKQSGQDNKRPRRVLGPEKPAFLESHHESDYETWVPPKGQSGDGRTSLNDRLGY